MLARSAVRADLALPYVLGVTDARLNQLLALNWWAVRTLCLARAPRPGCCSSVLQPLANAGSKHAGALEAPGRLGRGRKNSSQFGL